MKKKKYVMPSVEVHVIETSQLLAGSGATNSSSSVNDFGDGGSIGGGDMTPSSTTSNHSIWD